MVDLKHSYVVSKSQYELGGKYCEMAHPRHIILSLLDHSQRLQLPAVMTCDLRLNEPRFAALKNIMKARKAPMETLELSNLGIDVSKRLETLRVDAPPPRKGGGIVASVAELVDKLRNEAKVIN